MFALCFGMIFNTSPATMSMLFIFHYFCFWTPLTIPCVFSFDYLLYWLPFGPCWFPLKSFWFLLMAFWFLWLFSCLHDHFLNFIKLLQTSIPKGLAQYTRNLEQTCLSFLAWIITSLRSRLRFSFLLFWCVNSFLTVLIIGALNFLLIPMESLFNPFEFYLYTFLLIPLDVLTNSLPIFF